MTFSDAPTQTWTKIASMSFRLPRPVRNWLFILVPLAAVLLIDVGFDAMSERDFSKAVRDFRNSSRSLPNSMYFSRAAELAHRLGLGELTLGDEGKTRVRLTLASEISHVDSDLGEQARKEIPRILSRLLPCIRERRDSLGTITLIQQASDGHDSVKVVSCLTVDAESVALLSQVTDEPAWDISFKLAKKTRVTLDTASGKRFRSVVHR